MLNTLEAYAELGKKAGTAQNHGDAATVRFHTDHYMRMKGLEQGADRVAARDAFDEAYRAVRNVPRVASWR